MILYVRKTGDKAGHEDTKRLLPEAFLHYRERYGLAEKAPLAWSVTHTGRYLLCLVSHECRRVGVDAETLIDRPFAKLSERYLFPEEQAYAAKEGPAGFYRIWTRKEGLVKFLRAELYTTLSTRRVVENGGLMESACGAYFHEVDLTEELLCTVCADRKDVLKDCSIVTMS